MFLSSFSTRLPAEWFVTTSQLDHHLAAKASRISTLPFTNIISVNIILAANMRKLCTHVLSHYGCSYGRRASCPASCSPFSRHLLSLKMRYVLASTPYQVSRNWFGAEKPGHVGCVKFEHPQDVELFISSISSHAIMTEQSVEASFIYNEIFQICEEISQKMQHAAVVTPIYM